MEINVVTCTKNFALSPKNIFAHLYVIIHVTILTFTGGMGQLGALSLLGSLGGGAV